MVQFEERSEIEKGFAPIFAERIAPELDRLDGERLSARAKGRRHLLISLGIGAVLGLAIWALFGRGEGGAIGGGVVFAICALIGFGLRASAAGDWAETLSALVMPEVCAHLGGLDYIRGNDGADFAFSRAARLGLYGGYDRSKIRHRIAGAHRGVPFVVVDAELTDQQRDSDGKTKTVTVFRGMLFEIGVPQTSPGRILIARDYGAMGNRIAGFFKGKQGRGLPRVETGHPRFEAAFELHAERPDDAAAYLPAGLLDTLVDIAEHEGGSARSMTAAFDGDLFFLALTRSESFLAFHGLNRPASAIAEDLHGVFDDLTLVHRIIDRLADAG